MEENLLNAFGDRWSADKPVGCGIGDSIFKPLHHVDLKDPKGEGTFRRSFPKVIDRNTNSLVKVNWKTSPENPKQCQNQRHNPYKKKKKKMQNKLSNNMKQ